MGLAEKRAVETYKKESLETQCKRLTTLCGYPLQVEINWESIESDPKCVWFFEKQKLESFFFDRMEVALQQVCQDQMGRDALKAKIDKVTFKNASEAPKIDGRSLVVECRLDGSGAYDGKQIAEVLEKNL